MKFLDEIIGFRKYQGKGAVDFPNVVGALAEAPQKNKRLEFISSLLLSPLLMSISQNH